MKTRERITLQTTLIAIIMIVAIIYALFIKPNYYKFNGGRIYLEPIYSESFASKDAYEIYAYDDFLYYSSRNGLKKLTKERESIWDKSFYLKNPKLYTDHQYMAVVDMGGKEVYTFDAGGPLKTFEVEAPIILADINKFGALVLVQEKDGKHIIQYYGKNGELIAERGTNYSTDGYPIGVDLSNDGKKLVTSYLTVKDGVMKSTITFFSFGKEDNKDPENILGGFILEETLAPEVKFLDDTHLVVISDNSLNFYNVKEAPVLETKISVKNEIEQVAYANDKVIVYYGKQFEVTKDDMQHKIELYSSEGEKLDAYKVPENVTKIIEDGEHYYVITAESISYYNMKKRLWEAEMSKEAKNILKVSNDKYLIVFQQGFQILEVKDI